MNIMIDDAAKKATVKDGQIVMPEGTECVVTDIKDGMVTLKTK